MRHPEIWRKDWPLQLQYTRATFFSCIETQKGKTQAFGMRRFEPQTEPTASMFAWCLCECRRRGCSMTRRPFEKRLAVRRARKISLCRLHADGSGCQIPRESCTRHCVRRTVHEEGAPRDSTRRARRIAWLTWSTIGRRCEISPRSLNSNWTRGRPSRGSASWYRRRRDATRHGPVRAQDPGTLRVGPRGRRSVPRLRPWTACPRAGRDPAGRPSAHSRRRHRGRRPPSGPGRSCRSSGPV